MELTRQPPYYYYSRIRFGERETAFTSPASHILEGCLEMSNHDQSIQDQMDDDSWTERRDKDWNRFSNIETTNENDEEARKLLLEVKLCIAININENLFPEILSIYIKENIK